MTVTLYSKPSCVQCTASEMEFKRLGIDYTKVDLTRDVEALDRVMSLGYMQAPVVFAGDDHWSGFNPDKIKALVAPKVDCIPCGF